MNARGRAAIAFTAVVVLESTIVMVPHARAEHPQVEEHEFVAPVPFVSSGVFEIPLGGYACVDRGAEGISKATYRFTAEHAGLFEAVTEEFGGQWILNLMTPEGEGIDQSFNENPERVLGYLEAGEAVDVIVCNYYDPGYPAEESVHVTMRMPAECVATPESTEYENGGEPTSATPNDPLYDKQWGLDVIHAPDAWEQGATGAGAVIAIVDTGVDLEHPDLVSNIVEGADFRDGPADCGTGPDDEDRHGTMAAGIAAADGDNGIGMVGVAPDASIMPIRNRLSSEAAQTTAEVQAAADGIIWAADHGADVINMSWAREVLLGESDGALRQAVEYAWRHGVVLVAAAGNFAWSHKSPPVCDTVSPANLPHVICVGGIDKRGRLGPYYSFLPSKRGTEPGSIGVRAPTAFGTLVVCDEEILVTLPGGRGGCGYGLGYGASLGTSFAAPHVAGVAALLAGLGLDNHEIVECIRNTSFNPRSNSHGDYDPYYGYGIVDAGFAVETCAPQGENPGAPTAQLAVTPTEVVGNGTIDIRASVSDPDGSADLVAVSLTIVDSHGKVVDEWQLEDFVVSYEDALVLDLSDYRLDGADPWTITLHATDTTGNETDAASSVTRRRGDRPV